MTVRWRLFLLLVLPSAFLMLCFVLPTFTSGESQQFSTQNGDFPSYLVAAVFFILITIPLARFTDHLVAQRERRERAQAF